MSKTGSRKAARKAFGAFQASIRKEPRSLFSSGFVPPLPGPEAVSRIIKTRIFEKVVKSPSGNSVTVMKYVAIGKIGIKANRAK